MKKILLIIMVVFALCIENVNAYYFKTNSTNYLINTDFYCGNVKVVPNFYVNKTGKLEVFDDESNEYIWSAGNICRTKTDQDMLDDYNSKFEDILFDSTSSTFTHIVSDVNYYIYYIKPTGEFDLNETYYEVDFMSIDKVSNPSEDQFDNYYVPILLKYPDKTIYDPNITYYTVSNSIATVATDVIDDNVINLFVKVTKEEINLSIETYSVDKTKYQNINDNSSYMDYMFFDGMPVFKVYDNDGNIKYINSNFNEITKYYNYEIEKNDYYTVYMSKDYKNIKVYDALEKNIIYEYSFTENEILAGVSLRDTSAIILAYRDSDTLSTYINLYKPIYGDNQTYNGNDITIEFNGNYYSFEKLELNGQTITSDNYTISKGSTVVKLKKEYLNTLVDGTYEISAIYSDGGKAIATLVIGKEENPNTYDNFYLYIILCLISSFGIIYSLKKMKKSN